MLNFVKNIVFGLGGRHAIYRLGRAMYMHARGDIANDLSTNGEMLIQECIFNAWDSSLVKNKRLVIFDVGANIGDWSAPLLRQFEGRSMEGRAADIYCFEPVPAAAETLRINLDWPRPYLHIEEVALSSEKGRTDMFIAGRMAGTNSLYADAISSKAKMSINLTTATDFCEENGIDHVHLLKCDTEGHDMDVIRGSLPLLIDERVSVLQFEYNHCWVYSRNFLRDVFVAIQPLPYKVAKLQTDHLLVFDNWHPELDKFFEGNYALVHSDAVAWFPHYYAGFDKRNTLSIAMR